MRKINIRFLSKSLIFHHFLQVLWLFRFFFKIRFQSSPSIHLIDHKKKNASNHKIAKE